MDSKKECDIDLGYMECEEGDVEGQGRDGYMTWRRT
jgi:hypothetical protein